MLKNKKMSTSLVVLYLIANANMTKAMKNNAKDNMHTALEAQSAIIEDYIEKNERTNKTAETLSQVVQVNNENAESLIRLT